MAAGCRWLPQEPPETAAHRALFEYHPYLAVAPRRGASYRFPNGVVESILPDGTRSLGPAQRELPTEAPVVVCLGGSSTYGVGVSDGATWPAALQRALGDAARVTNMGVPGYTTVEAVIQASLSAPESPRLVFLCYEGWNDARNMNVEGLRSDYSDFHGRTQLSNLGVVPPPEETGSSALAFVLRRVAIRCGVRDDPYAAFRAPRVAGGPVDRVDPIALDLYGRHLRSLVDACRARGGDPVLVPQVMNYARLDREGAYGWAPRVRDRFWRPTMAAYNAKMREVARERGVPLAEEVLEHEWTDADFLDHGHFSEAGDAKFATILAPYVRSALARPK